MNIPEFITLGGIDFLPHTWPLVFGVPMLLILSGLVGICFELFSKEK